MTEKVGSNSNGSRKNKAWNSDFWLEELSKLSDGHALKSDCWNASSTIHGSDQDKHNVKDDWDSENDPEENQKEKEKETMDLDNIHIDWSLSDDDKEEQNDDNKVSSSLPIQQQQQQQEKEDLHVSETIDNEIERSIDILSSESQEKNLNEWSPSASTLLVDIEPISMKLAPVLTPTPIMSKKSLFSTTTTTTTTTETSQLLLIDNENEKVVDVIPQSSIKLCNQQFSGSLDFSLLDSGDDGNDEDESYQEEEYQKDGEKVLSISISNKPSTRVDTESDDYHDDNKLFNLQQPSAIQDEHVDSILGSQKKPETTAQSTTIQMNSTNQTKETLTSPSEKQQDMAEIKSSVVQNPIVSYDDTSSIILSLEDSNVNEEYSQPLTFKDDLTTTILISYPSATVVELKGQQSIIPNQSSRPSSSLSSSSSSATACMHDSPDEGRTEPISPTKLDLSGKEENDLSIKQLQTLVDQPTLLEQEKKEEFVHQVKKDTIVIATTKHLDGDDEQEMSQMNAVDEQGELLINIDSLVLTDQKKSKEDKGSPESLANENKSSLLPSIEKACTEWEPPISIWAQSVEKMDERSVNMSTTRSSSSSSSSSSKVSSAKSSPKLKDQEQGLAFSIWAQPTEELKKEKEESAAMISIVSSETLTPKVEQQGTKLSMWAPPKKKVNGELVATTLSTQSCSKIEQPMGTAASIWSPGRRTTINISKQQDEEEQKPVSPSTKQSTTSTSSIWSPAPPAKRVTIQKEEQAILSSTQKQDVNVASSTNWSSTTSLTIQDKQICSPPSLQQQNITVNETIWSRAPAAKSITISPSKEQIQTATIYASTSWSPASSTAIQENQNHLSSSTKQKVSTTDDSIWSPVPPSSSSIIIREETKNPVSFEQQAASFAFSWDSSKIAKNTTTSSVGQQEQNNPMTLASATAVTTTTKKREQHNIATEWSSSAASIWNSKTLEATTTQQQTTSNTIPGSSSISTLNQNNITTEKPFTFDYQLHKIPEEDSDEEEEEESDDGEELDDDDDDDEEKYETGSEYNSDDDDDDSVEQITINLASLVQAKKEEQKKKEPPVIRCTLSDLILGMKSEKIRNILDELSGKTSFSNVPSSSSTTTTKTTAQQEQPQEQQQEEQQENNIQPPSSVSSTTSTSLSSAPSAAVKTNSYTHQQQQEDKKESTPLSPNVETKRKMSEKAKQFDNKLKLNAFADTFTPPTFASKSITTATTLSNIDYKQSAGEEENGEDEKVFNYVPEHQYQQDQFISTVPLSYNQQVDLLSAPKYFESVDQPQQQSQYTSLNKIQYYPKTTVPSVLSTPEALSQHPSLATPIQSDSSMMTRSTTFPAIGGIANNNNYHSFPSTDLATNYMTYNKDGTLYFNTFESPPLSTTNDNSGTPLLKTPTSTKIKISAPDSPKSNTDKFDISAPHI